MKGGKQHSSSLGVSEVLAAHSAVIPPLTVPIKRDPITIVFCVSNESSDVTGYFSDREIVMNWKYVRIREDFVDLVGGVSDGNPRIYTREIFVRHTRKC